MSYANAELQMNVKAEAAKVKAGPVQTIRGLEYTTNSDIKGAREKLKQLGYYDPNGPKMCSRSLSINKRESYYVKPGYKELSTNVDFSDVDNLQSRNTQGYIDEIFRKTFNKKAQFLNNFGPADFGLRL